MDKFNWAILGLGKIATKFAEDVRLLENAQLAAVGSRSLERARAFAEQYGAAFAAGSYEEALTEGRIDAVYIATPHIQHKELAVLCLEKGIPVLCEKPLGLNLSEVTSILKTAATTGTYLMEALWTRFLPSTLRLKELIDGGAIGEVQSIRSDFGFRAADLNLALLPDDASRLDTELDRGRPASPPPNRSLAHTRNRILDPALGGGALLDIGIYPQFLSQFLLGEPQEINATARLSAQGIDLDTSVTCVHDGGKLSHNYSTILGRTKTEALIIGTEGSIHWHPRWHEPTSFSILRGKDDPPENFYFEYGAANGYKFEAEAVMADVRAGKKENALWSHADSLALHRTLTLVREQVEVRYPGEQ